MYYLKGNPTKILNEIEKLNNYPPEDWKKYDCSDKKYSDGYYWFEYVGEVFPKCLLYFPKEIFFCDKVFFMFLPNENDEIETLVENFENIVGGFFKNILCEEIVLLRK